jgi:peptidoglycan/LPS O-acetylase OafA/YrhL
MQASTSPALLESNAPAFISNAAGKSVAATFHEHLPPLPALTAIRFFMALPVLGIHYFGTFNGPKPVEICTQLMDVIVPAFYALSGFVLTYQYGSKNKAALADYFVARFARIFPLYWFCLFLAIAIGPIQFICPTNCSLAFGAFVFGVQSWFPSSDIFWAFNPPSYSLSAEIAFYCLFPFLLSRGLKTTLVAFAASFLVICCLAATTPTQYRGFALCVLPLTSLFYFLAGIICSRIFLNAKDKQTPPGSFSFLVTSIVEVTTVTAFWSAKSLCHLLPWPNFPTELIAEKCFGTLSFLCFIYALALQKGFISRVLSNRYLFILGNASYAMYLLHAIFQRALQNYHLDYEQTGWGGFISLTVFTIAVSVCAHYLIESPWRRYIIDKFRSKNVADDLRSFASRSFVFLPLLVVCFFAATGWWPKARLSADYRLDAKVDQAAITCDTKNVLFGGAFRLNKVLMWKCKDGVQVRTFWTAEKKYHEHVFLCVHVLDKTGSIRKNLDHELCSDYFVDKGTQWCNSFIIPEGLLSISKTIGVAVCPDPQHLLSVDGGSSDWDQRRLLIPFDLDQLTLKELRQSGNGAI